MSDKMRWRYGDTNPVIAAVDAETVIEIGDMVWQDEDFAKPETDCPLGDFKSSFLGVAMQRSRKGDIASLRVGTTGVYQFDCEAGTFRLGDFVSSRGNQGVQLCSRSLAIGRVARREPTLVASVLVAIRSTVMTNGV